MRFKRAMWLAAIAYLSLLAGRRWSGKQTPSRPPKCRVDDASATDYGAPPPTPEHPHPATLTAASGHEHSSDSNQHRPEGRKWGRGEIIGAVSAAATLAGSAFAAGALVAALEAVSETRRQANVAQAALVNADRPWIKVVGVSVISLKISSVGAALTSKINIRNVGRSPAEYTSVRSELVANSNIIDDANEAVFLCRRAAKAERPLDDRLVFPDEGGSLFDISFVNMDSINRSIEKEAIDGRDAMRRGFGDKTAENYWKWAKESPPIASLIFMWMCFLSNSGRASRWPDSIHLQCRSTLWHDSNSFVCIRYEQARRPPQRGSDRSRARWRRLRALTT